MLLRKTDDCWNCEAAARLGGHALSLFLMLCRWPGHQLITPKICSEVTVVNTHIQLSTGFVSMWHWSLHDLPQVYGKDHPFDRGVERLQGRAISVFGGALILVSDDLVDYVGWSK